LNRWELLAQDAHAMGSLRAVGASAANDMFGVEFHRALLGSFVIQYHFGAPSAVQCADLICGQ
jgi:hypothetical protein